MSHSYVTVPISFLAAMQIGLFRNIGDLAYLPVATTGNMMRFMESGAVSGSVASLAWGVHAIWLPAGFLAITLCLFIADERRLRSTIQE